MTCKLSIKTFSVELNPDDPSDPHSDITKEYNTCAEYDIDCKGEPQDKAECPLWSGCLEKQTFIRPITMRVPK